MRFTTFFILIALGFLIACKTTVLPKPTRIEPKASPSLADQTITRPPKETRAVDEFSPVATPAKKLIETSQNLPVATALPEASVAIGSETESDDRRAIFPNTIIVYQREGRFPGSPQQWTIYHTGRIVTGDGTEWQTPAPKVKLLFDLVESPDFWELNDRYTPGGKCLDCLVQTVTIYYEGEIKEIVVTNEPSDLPQNLKQTLDKLDSLTSQ